jgi:hypothetical protein
MSPPPDGSWKESVSHAAASSAMSHVGAAGSDGTCGSVSAAGTRGRKVPRRRTSFRSADACARNDAASDGPSAAG